jgi:hypothetical protein
MQIRHIGRSLVATVALAGVVSPAWGQAPAPPPTPTLWSFLGIPQGLRFLRDNTLNRTGNRPALERKPPLKPIGDPSNLKSEDPAIKKAAEVKQAEDQKKQKIKAVKFLAQIGCGCYNRDGSITDALAKAMDDCTEEVRLATVQAITEAAMGEVCVNCKRRSCCSEELTNKLYEIAYERDETGCFLEPSERVRNAAAEALRACCAQTEEFAPLTPVPSGGERPGAAPPEGGERPQPPQPTPAQPPAALLPGYGPEPAGFAPVRAPAEVPPASVLPRSSRRTSQTPSASSQSDRTVHSEHASSAGQPLDASTWLSAGATESRPHWTPASSTSRVTFLPPSRLLPLDASTVAEPPLADLVPTAAALAHQPAPRREVAMASFQRLPAIHGPEPGSDPSQIEARKGALTPTPPTHTLPPPPLPPAPAATASTPGAPAVPVSAARAQMSFLKRSDGAPLAAAGPTYGSATSAQPGLNRPAPVVTAAALPAGIGGAPALRKQQPEAPGERPASPRRPLPPLPGAQFGTGSVLSVRPKDNLVVLQFAPGSAVPAGSLVRVYHEFALAGKKAVCDLEVVRGENGIAAAVPREGSTLAQVNAGDEAIVLR